MLRFHQTKINKPPPQQEPPWLLLHVSWVFMLLIWHKTNSRKRFRKDFLQNQRRKGQPKRHQRLKNWLARLVGNEGPSTFTLVYWGFIPSFPTKGQLEKWRNPSDHSCGYFPAMYICIMSTKRFLQFLCSSRTKNCWCMSIKRFLQFTPPKFNSSSLKSYRNPIGSRIVFQASLCKLAVKLRGCNISPSKSFLSLCFPFPKVGYVSVPWRVLVYCTTVDGSEIPNNHLGWCWNPINNGIFTISTGELIPDFRDFSSPSTVVPVKIPIQGHLEQTARATFSSQTSSRYSLKSANKFGPPKEVGGWNLFQKS